MDPNFDISQFRGNSLDIASSNNQFGTIVSNENIIGVNERVMNGTVSHKNNDIKCNACKNLDVNYASDEAYCSAAEGEEIILKSGQKRPKWCPLKKNSLKGN